MLTVTGNGSALFAVIFAAHVYRAKLDDARANSHDRYASRDDGMMDSLSEDILGTLDENELEEAGGFSVDLGDSRACRHQMEIVMRDAIM